MAATTIASSWPLAPTVTVRRRYAPGRVGFWALSALTFIALFAPQEWIPPLAAIRPGLIATIIGAIAITFERLKRGQTVLLAEREIHVIMALVTWALITTPLSYWPGGSLATLFDVAAKSFVLYWLVAQTVTTLARQWKILWTIVIFAGPAAQAGIENFLKGNFLENSDRIVGYRAGLTGNPNDHALVMNLVLPLAVALLIDAKRWAARALLSGLIALLVVSTVVTFSRGGFIQLAVIAITYLAKLWRQGRKTWTWAVVVIVLLALPALPGRYVSRITTIGDVKSDATGSSQERWRDLKAAARYFVAHPVIGAGIGQAILAMNAERGETWRVVHNVFLEYGVELGLPGLTMFVMLLLFTMQNAAIARRVGLRLGNRRLFTIAEGLQVSLIGFLAAAPFHPGGYNFLFFYIAGLTLALRRLAMAELQEASRAPVEVPATASRAYA